MLPGGFYSTQDADSEGVEGKFFVWTREEVISLLGEEDGELFCAFYDISEDGNFEEKNILNIGQPLEALAAQLGMADDLLGQILARGRQRLLTVREERIHPGRDEKMLTSWNGLMLRSFAEAARGLEGKTIWRSQSATQSSCLLTCAAMVGSSEPIRRVRVS